MELIENLLQLLVTFVGALLSGISYRKSRRQAYFLLLCFVFAEYLLWTAGCFWPDMLLTLTILGLLPAVRKAVDA